MRARRVAVAALVLAGACRSGPPEHAPAVDTLLFERPLLGVRFQIVLCGPDPIACAELAGEAFAEVERLEALLSNWSEDSALSRLNADARAGAVAVDPELGAVLEAALAFCEQSRGTFDPTVGVVLSEMGFYGGAARALSEAELRRLRGRIGCGLARVERDGDERRLVRAVDGVHLDLSAVSKGWAVDRVIALLVARGVTNAFVAAGESTVFGLGPGPGGRGWDLGVPGREGGTVTWHLRDEAVSTSGRLSQPFDTPGGRLSHVIDPHTARPVAHELEMTVFRGPRATEADMASTALLVLGPERAFRWLAEQPEWAKERRALLVVHSRDRGRVVIALGGRADD